jgi:hypothetical protein
MRASLSITPKPATAEPRVTTIGSSGRIVPSVRKRSSITSERKAGNRQTLKLGELIAKEEERVKAHKALTAALGPQGKGWHVWLGTLISMGLVWGFADYVSLGAGIAMATFFIIRTMHYLAEAEGSRRLAVREAQRDADEWDRIHTKFLAHLD